jgi:hypothetical protein
VFYTCARILDDRIMSLEWCSRERMPIRYLVGLLYGALLAERMQVISLDFSGRS